ncbi:MAG: hypothetical protein LBQ54_10835 [Planctomycetaceae bacterium]|jgi:hypothetical protein|nr:hypothetical protein [Planctomycetaceae bacterium]
MENLSTWESEGNCGEAACFPAPVSRWNQQAEQKEMLPEQREKDNNESRPRSREASAIQRATLAGRAAVLRNVIPMVLMKTRTRCGLRLTPVKCSIRAAASLADAIGIR